MSHVRNAGALPILSGRDCGECRECCIHVPMQRFNKPAGVNCPHLSRTPQACGSCLIYADRPQECVDYACTWKAAEWLDARAFRPDRCGLLFETSWFNVPGGTYSLVIGFEIKEGALRKMQRRLMKHCPADTIVATNFRDKTRQPEVIAGSDKARAAYRWFMRNAQAHGSLSIQALDARLEFDV